ncbi:MAG TPA: hypothetical protein VMA33_06735, partial [Candidatus Tectomicrobia bacterium]|nr:hypothetical protein [Candidatus Tectomicrobia bacterium]
PNEHLGSSQSGELRVTFRKPQKKARRPATNQQKEIEALTLGLQKARVQAGVNALDPKRITTE